MDSGKPYREAIDPREQAITDETAYDNGTYDRLMRALSEERLIGFLGSGISVPHGYPDWSKLTYFAVKEALHSLKNAESVGDPQIQHHRKALEKQLKNLKKKFEKSAFVSAEEKMMGMSIAGVAFDHCKEHLNPNQTREQSERQGPTSLGECIARWSGSDHENAKDLLAKRLSAVAQILLGSHEENNRENILLEFIGKCERSKAAKGKKSKRHYDQINLKKNYIIRYEQFYSYKTISKLIIKNKVLGQILDDKKFPKELSLLLSEMIEWLKDDFLKKSSESMFLSRASDANNRSFPVDRRSFLGTLLVTVALIVKAADNKKNDYAEKYWRTIKAYAADFVVRANGSTDQWRRMVGSTTAATLSSHIPKAKKVSDETRPVGDPIRALIEDVGLRRFITTNYDLELERFISRQHSHFDVKKLWSETVERQPDEPPYYLDARNSTGDVASTDVLVRDRLDSMLMLSCNSASNEYNVLHLHGRADAESTVIASEEQYQKLYVRQRSYQEDMSTALNVLLSGNPVLFVGSGLGEEDLLRPMRDYAGNTPKSRREMIALMPAIESTDERSAIKARHAARHGVRILYYGEGIAKAKEPKTETQAYAKIWQLSPLEISLHEVDEVAKSFSGEYHSLRSEYILGTNNPGKNKSKKIILKSLRRLCSHKIYGRDISLQDLACVELFKDGADCNALKHFEKLVRALCGAKIGVTIREFALAVDVVDTQISNLRAKSISTSLHRALDEISHSQRKWLRDARAATSPRRTVGENARDGAVIFERHAIAWPGPHDAENKGDIFSSYRKSRNGFALEILRALDGLEKKSARLVVLTSEHNGGKGALMDAFREGVAGATGLAPYSHMAFASLSHSIEFSSVLIQLTNFLESYILASRKCSKRGEKHRRKEFAAYKSKVGYLDYLERLVSEILREEDPSDQPQPSLDRVLRSREKQKRKGFPRRSWETMPRGLIVLSGLNHLTNINSKPHTMEIRRTMAAISRLATSSAPIHIIIITNKLSKIERVLPRPYVKRKGEGTDENIAGFRYKRCKHWLETPDDNNIPDTPVRLLHFFDKGGRAAMLPFPATLEFDSKGNRIVFDTKMNGRQRASAQHLAKKDPLYIEKIGANAEKYAELCNLIRPYHYTGVVTRELISQMQEAGVDDARIGDVIDQFIAIFTSSAPDMIRTKVFSLIFQTYRECGVSKSGNTSYHKSLPLLILRVLAVVGFPVEVAVLARVSVLTAPLKESRSQKKKKNKKKLSEADKIAEDLRKVMNDLVRLHLVTRIQPRKRGKGDGDVPTLEEFPAYRYAIHPYMREYILKTLSEYSFGAEYTNPFVFSVYATQPADVAIMSDDIKGMVDKIIDDLTAAWRVFQLDDAKLEYARGKIKALKDGEGLPRKNEPFYGPKSLAGALARASADMPFCFRAAYGVIRQMRPFAAVTRMEPPKEARYESPFASTSRQIKDLIYGISSAHSSRKFLSNNKLDFIGNENSYSVSIIRVRDKEPENALYSHEVAWLWNERGVLALAQGRLYEAIPFLRHARNELQGIQPGDNTSVYSGSSHEGPGSLGPMTMRIDLNLAIALIERGQFKRAEKMLRAIRAEMKHYLTTDTGVAEFEVDKIVTLALGTISFYRGDTPIAHKRLTSAVDEFVQSRRYRAASISLQHLARVHVQLGDFDEAESTLDRALSAAESLKQLDLMHSIGIDRMLVALSREDSQKIKASMDPLMDALRYAENADIPRIEVDALLALVTMELRNGQTLIGGQYASRALAIATRHGMRLRQIRATSLLSQVFMMSEDKKTALNLLNFAEQHAHKTNYVMALRTIERIRAEHT